VSAVCETLRCGISKHLSAVQDMMSSCRRVISVLHKDQQDFDDHVTRVSAEIRAYVRQQKLRVADDANVSPLQAFFLKQSGPKMAQC